MMEKVLPRAIGAPLGHQGRPLRCPRPPRTLRSRRARPDPHESPLLCGRRQRQLFCSRGAPAAEGVEARGGRGGGDRHVLHAIGPVASVGPNGRHAASASAGRLCRRKRCAEPAGRAVAARALPVQARAGTGALGADATSLVGISSSRRARSVGAPVPSPLICPARLLRLLPHPRRCGRHTQAHATRLALAPRDIPHHRYPPGSLLPHAQAPLGPCYRALLPPRTALAAPTP